MTDKGEAGFENITYRGKPLLRQLDAGVDTIYIDHFYRANAANIFMKTAGGRGRHACLEMGFWCWKNVREHPLDLLPYLRKKARQQWLIP